MKGQRKYVLYLLSILLSGVLVYFIWLQIIHQRQTPKSNPYYKQHYQVTVDSLLVESNYDMVFGDSTAPLTIVMFSNYYCSYCIDFFEQCFPELDKQYLKTGKVRLVVKWLAPLLDQDVKQAMQMVACLSKHGNPDKIHQLLLFNNQVVHTSEFKSMMDELKIKDDNIHQCLTVQNAYIYLKDNVHHFHELGLKGTPAFVINGKIYKGFFGCDFFMEWVQYQYESLRWPFAITN